MLQTIPPNVQFTIEAMACQGSCEMPGSAFQFAQDLLCHHQSRPMGGGR